MWWKDVERTVDIAESTSFALLCVMQPARPVDSNIALLPIQPSRTLHTASCAYAAELEQSVKHRTVVSYVVSALLLRVRVHIVGCHFLQELDVLVSVKLCHLELGRWFGTVDFEFAIESVIHDQGVSHSNPMRFHGVAGVVGIVADITIVEVCDLLGLRWRSVDTGARRVQGSKGALLVRHVDGSTDVYGKKLNNVEESFACDMK